VVFSSGYIKGALFGGCTRPVAFPQTTGTCSCTRAGHSDGLLLCGMMMNSNTVLGSAVREHSFDFDAAAASIRELCRYLG
jgi:hypothetical protein